ncbi:hypothetical protein ASPZODRAFT_2041224 [Penicilliopsis zonata CBS 506.65]|uniref:Uncharacterized protein n=1 Tax=Penicilliopsis zonata CBS 506.65 TaxID=1073090 RepID=A0A1L9SGA4_9EURO|nr:hypothetical protein ASPZODRAFT_2041224 [Penicilliopsis zonata CBS 506.65]OJJ46074.1 hypothetical protein ASPZODRAFT_2041224 [Penicilliopsis zonata CBS 506.65]
MSRVSISRSYAVLVGIEGYTKTKRKVRALHEKVDSSKQKFHQRREENATNDDSDEGTTHHHYWTGGSQAEEEKQFLASTIGRSSDPQAVITGGPKGKRLWGTLKNLARRGSKDELVSSPTPTTAPTTGSVRMQGRGIPGTAPEEGVPPPEGKR